jgi:hypothetical protein
MFLRDEGSATSLSPTAPLPGDPGGIYGSAGIGVGQLDFTNASSLLPAISVEFWQSFGGDKDAVNLVSFTPGPTANVSPGDEFLIGTFTFTNGGWFGSLPLTDANGAPYVYTYPESEFFFSITTASADSTLDGHTFSGTLRLHVTGADVGAPPADDADYFYFAERLDLGYVGAFESYNTPAGGSSTGSIDLYGKIGSLTPTRFANAQGVVLASELPTPAVPLPPAWALLGGALIPIGAMLRRRRAA